LIERATLAKGRKQSNDLVHCAPQMVLTLPGGDGALNAAEIDRGF